MQSEDYNEALKQLQEYKPPPRPDGILPDLVVYTEQPSGPKGTPEVVAKRLLELREDRERIAKMWKQEGKTRAYIPNTAEARRMQLQAKLHNRAEAKHAEIIKQELVKVTRPIQLPEDAVILSAVEL
ncbi:MAG: hypothetical protein ACR2IJ_06015 [Fluviibacter sp.]